MYGSRSRAPNSEWEDKAMRKCSVLLVALTLSACGSRTPLTPPEGQSLPPKPLAATKTPTPLESMEPSAQARQGRRDALLKQSEQRKTARLHLPHAGTTDTSHIPYRNLMKHYEITN